METIQRSESTGLQSFTGESCLLWSLLLLGTWKKGDV